MKLFIAITMVSVCSANFDFFKFFAKMFESKKGIKTTKFLEKIPVYDVSDRFYYDSSDVNNWNNDMKSKTNIKENFKDENLIQSAFTPLSIYENELVYKEKQRTHDGEGIFNSILQFFDLAKKKVYTKRLSAPLKISNKTNGLDVRLKSMYFTSMLMETVESQFKLIYPGTLWCGGGTLANSDNHYGFFRKTDRCCRKHDTCPKYILPGETWKNLENNGIFTRSHCECDRAFYTCLKRTNSIISNKIGITYFNVLRPQCFRKEYPIVSCLDKRQDGRCFNYVIDDSKSKMWQWFDNKIY